jgi:hypothetical protein
MLEGVMANCPGTLAVPASGIDKLGFEPFELIARFPLKLPPTLGVNVTLKVTLWAGDRVTGGFTPLMLKPVPLGAICEMVRVEAPEFVSLSASVLLLPVATVPKFKLVGLAESWPGVAAVPDSDTFRVGLDALELIARLPVTLPAELG